MNPCQTGAIFALLKTGFSGDLFSLMSPLFGVSTFETVWGFRLEEGFGLIAVT